MRYLVIIPIIASLASCISADEIWSTARPRERVVSVDLEIFSKLPVGMSGKLVKVIPTREKNGLIEYEIYGEYVKAGFASIGWIVTENEEDADYIAVFDYLTDGGVEQVETEVVPQFGQTGTSSARTSGYLSPHGGYNSTTTFTPTFGITGTREIKKLITEYGHAASVSIYRSSQGEFDNVFLGVSSKSTRKSDRRKLIEHMYKAVFLNLDDNGEDIAFVPTGEFAKNCSLWC